MPWIFAPSRRPTRVVREALHCGVRNCQSPCVTTAAGWLARYVDGEQEQVWHELRQLGARVREPAFAEGAQAVCDEMARRARSNIEVIIARLYDQGYRSTFV